MITIQNQSAMHLILRWDRRRCVLRVWMLDKAVKRRSSSIASFPRTFHRSTWCDGVVLKLAGSVEFILRGLTTFSEFPSNDFWFSAEIAEMSWYWKDFSFRMHCSYLFLISWLLSQFLFTLKYVASCDVRAALRSYLNPIWDFFASQILSKNKGGSFISRCY